MIKAKTAFLITKGINEGSGTKSNKTLLKDSFTNMIVSKIYYEVMRVAINEGGSSVTVKFETPIPAEYRIDIGAAFRKWDYVCIFKLNEDRTLIESITVDWYNEESNNKYTEDRKTCPYFTDEELFKILSNNFYVDLDSTSFYNDVRIKLRLNIRYRNFDSLFDTINKYFNSNEEIMKAKENNPTEYYKTNLLANRVKYRDNRYQYTYKYLEDMGIIPVTTSSKNNIKYILNTLFYNCDINAIYNRYTGYTYDMGITKHFMVVDINTACCLLKEYVTKADAISKILNYIDKNFKFTRKYKTDFIFKDTENKYKGLDVNISTHIYYTTKGPNKLITLERSPKLKTKGLYDRIRIQFSVLGVDDKKKFFSVNKDIIIGHILNIISENKYFKTIPLNYFNISRIGINAKGDVEMFMELKDSLQKIQEEIESENMENS